MAKTNAATLKQGDTVKLNGTEFIVLDLIDGNPFLLLKNCREKSEFGSCNDYAKSKLRGVVERWLEDFLSDSGISDDMVYERKLDLLTMDGYKLYGKMTVKAAPLTIDEYRKYAEFIPRGEEGCYFWTVTGWGSPLCGHSNLAYDVVSDGAAYGDDCSYSIGVRPALILDSSLFDSEEEVDLTEVSTDDLLAEIRRRLG